MEQLSEKDRTKNVMDAVVFLDVLTTNMKVRDSPGYVGRGEAGRAGAERGDGGHQSEDAAEEAS
jgi:hypothetical protein